MARQKELSVPLTDWALAVAESGRFSAAAIRVAIRLARLSDDRGIIEGEQNGRPLADPRNIASALGAGVTTVYKCLSALDHAGVIAWDRAEGQERYDGISGRIRLILSSEKSE